MQELGNKGEFTIKNILEKKKIKLVKVIFKIVPN